MLAIFPLGSKGLASKSTVWKWQVRLCIVFVCLALRAHCQVRYSVPEEMAKGSLVGNIAQDLGLDTKRLKAGRARIFTEDSREYIGLNVDKGTLVIKEQIDREELCAQMSPCSLHFQIILENPMELHRIDVEIVDINDNTPKFSKKEINFEISELSLPGTKYALDSAKDPDVDLNTLQSYTINPSEHFILKTMSNYDGSKYAQMVLQKPLDREKQDEHTLTLTAFDGGDPQKSGTVKINIVVLDANDNAPAFSQPVYRATLPENAAVGTVVIRVTATDLDQGTNSDVIYAYSRGTESGMSLFKVDPDNGDITVSGKLDFEKSKQFQLDLEAIDKGGLTDMCKVIIELSDVNDNAPIISVISFSSPIPENSPPETVVAMLNVKDSDSGKNGQVKCAVSREIPFRITPSPSNIYSLVTDQILDRENIAEYNITITAIDEGFPPLSTNKTITLKISDINDNAPLFKRQTYMAYIMENNSPGTNIFTMEANDNDSGNNARVSYFLDDIPVNGISAADYVSVNAENGNIIATRSFDYEQLKDFRIRVKAQDGGSPPLSSNVSVNVIVQDQNDNAPQILYPVQSSGSVVAEIVPRSADLGYLVSKVVAVDVDSGQNAWLSYKLQKMSDRPLFEIGAQNGEIRTIRQVTDKDSVKQKLTVIVEDNGQPSRSATVNVNVALADSFPEVLSEFSDFTHDKDYNDNLTFYLVLALAVVSFLFIVSIISILSVKCYRWKRERVFSKSGGNLPVIPYYPPLYADVGGTGTLPHVYSYDAYRTVESRMSDGKYGGPCNQSIISLGDTETQTLSRAQGEINYFDGAEDKVRYMF